jgi:putative Mg2+ transporter-C (MgtC) family protein
MLPHREILARLLLAAALGSVIGFERERLLWTAGIRTGWIVPRVRNETWRARAMH